MFSIFRRKFGETLIKQFSRQSYSNVSSINQLSPLFLTASQHNLRFKSKGAKNKTPAAHETETGSGDSSNNVEEQVADKNSKIMSIPVKSTRIDLILKAGLGIARNKIETLFYESKIRVNGEKVLKKSILVNEGDEIDIVKGASIENPDFLTVARVEVLGVTEKGEGLSVKLRRCKSLTIENYEDKWKP